MVIRKSLRRLKDFTADAIPRLHALEVSGDLAQVRDLTVARYQTIDQQLQKHIAQMRAESVEAEEAGDQLDQAEGWAIDAYGTIYKGLRIGHLKAQVGGGATSDSHITNLNRFLEGNNPSDFNKVDVPAKIGYLQRAFQFRARFLDGHVDAALVEDAERALEQLQLAHKHWVTETQEADEVRAQIDTVEQEARTSYSTGRYWMRGCLTALGRADDLATLIRPLRDIYSSTPRNVPEDSEATEDHADTDEPAPSPA